MRLRASLAPAGPPPRILVNSMPKAGTHLVMQALDSFPQIRASGIHIGIKPILKASAEGPRRDASIPGSDLDWLAVRDLLGQAKYGQYVTAHLEPYEQFLEALADLEYKVIVVVRDPRDVAVSAISYIKRLRRHPRHRRFEGHASDRDRMESFISGYDPDELGRGFPSLRVRLERFRPWLDAPGTLVCRYEDLVGERGSGSGEAQMRTIRAIAEHINRPGTDQTLRRVARRTWSTRSATFRAGTTGEWRDHFDPALGTLFEREVSSELLASYGYARNHGDD